MWPYADTGVGLHDRLQLETVALKHCVQRINAFESTKCHLYHGTAICSSLGNAAAGRAVAGAAVQHLMQCTDPDQLCTHHQGLPAAKVCRCLSHDYTS